MISSSHRFIFVHCPKTGGNSVQDALRDVADEAFTTQGGNQDGKERFGLEHPVFPALKKHSPLSSYHDNLGEELSRYRVYTTIRNPFDRLVSHYFSPSRGRVAWDPTSFAAFVRRSRPLEYYVSLNSTEHSVEHVDRVLKFEHLSDDFAAMCNELGLGARDLPHRNQSENRRDYRNCYDESLRDFVFDRHALEISVGGYSFDGN